SHAIRPQVSIPCGDLRSAPSAGSGDPRTTIAHCAQAGRDSMRANADITSSVPATLFHQRRMDLLAITFLTLAVSTIYGARLAVQPLVGEETRWATGAREMLATGDWIVPRQQGHVFPERPPMTMWMMAIAGWMRGDVDPIA